ncbi:plasmid recombination protein [Vibrio fluvialis]|nr:plasmid recombination protein [Vibrio fluvialis]
MSEKKYCAVKTKYYKNSNASGEIGHILRLFKDNINTFAELTKNNFGYSFNEDLNLLENYNLNIAKANADLVARNKKQMQHNANTYVDSVLIFNRELFDKMIKDGRNDEIKQATKDFMNDFKEQYGFEPIGFEFHLDEGTEQEEDEDIKNNYHAHAIFLNYDFKNGKMPLRDMRKKDWGNSQDLLHKHFHKFGFERGIKKTLTKKEGKSKADYLKELQLEVIKNEKLVEDFDKLKSEYSDILNEIILEGSERELIDRELDNYNNLQVLAKNALKTLFGNTPFKNIVKQIEKKQPTVFKYIKQKGSELLELLNIKPSSFLPEPKQKVEVEANQPEPQPEAAIHQEPEPEPEELTVSEQIEAKREETKERLETMSIEEKEKERKKQDQRRKYGRGPKNK